MNCCGHFEVHLSTESRWGCRPEAQGDSMQDLSVTTSSEHTQNATISVGSEEIT